MSKSHGKEKRFVYLSQDFYNDYPSTKYPEIERKTTRPYIQVYVEIDSVKFALPLRSHIKHNHVVWTDKENGCGIDLSKAVVISDEKYIDHNSTPQLRQNEFNALKGKDPIIKSRFKNYIEKYKKAKEDLSDIDNKNLHDYSTLQYFEEYIQNIGNQTEQAVENNDSEELSLV